MSGCFGAGFGRLRQSFNSLAQYLARELSGRIKSGDLTTVEGAFLTDEDLVELVYVESDRQRVTSTPHRQWL